VGVEGFGGNVGARGVLCVVVACAFAPPALKRLLQSHRASVRVATPLPLPRHALADDTTSKKQFHCEDCGICRVGGRENFFHCRWA